MYVYIENYWSNIQTIVAVAVVVVTFATLVAIIMVLVSMKMVSMKMENCKRYRNSPISPPLRTYVCIVHVCVCIVHVCVCVCVCVLQGRILAIKGNRFFFYRNCRFQSFNWTPTTRLNSPFFSPGEGKKGWYFPRLFFLLLKFAVARRPCDVWVTLPEIYICIIYIYFSQYYPHCQKYISG